ncbi:hypothetical protein M758_1G276400 [Ceratodon purpureus]|uniref:DUF7734 domain-containing protein n=1 Tax=Ceratodon purpureus TaxID=3225 RepID=A0A8T0JDV2_CERPU|nr:hypothetical protein KC19_1G284900 [Ceratodon purpureus]KAG0631746.1 hypothetical protein M758_1G276400 [Ceratodon purpureus]
MAMATSLHHCALPPPPMPGSLSPRHHRPPGLAIRNSVFPTIQARFVYSSSQTGAWKSGCRRAGSLAAATGDEPAATAEAGSLQDLQDLPFDITRLEQYTEKVKNEVLRVHAVVDGEEDQVIVFKVFPYLLTSIPSPQVKLF